jgi:hypothetical protein
LRAFFRPRPAGFAGGRWGEFIQGWTAHRLISNFEFWFKNLQGCNLSDTVTECSTFQRFIIS